MKGSAVEIFLKTPLFRFKYTEGGKEQQLMENAVRLSGKIVEEREMGVMVKIKDISNQKEKHKDLPFETIFIPFDKIDFIIFT